MQTNTQMHQEKKSNPPKKDWVQEKPLNFVWDPAFWESFIFPCVKRVLALWKMEKTKKRKSKHSILQTHGPWTLSECACSVLTQDCAEVRTQKEVLISVKTILPFVGKIKVLTETLWLLYLWCWGQIINAICVLEIPLKFQLNLIYVLSASFPKRVCFWAKWFHLYSYICKWSLSYCTLQSPILFSFSFKLLQVSQRKNKKKTKHILTAVALFPLLSIWYVICDHTSRSLCL